MIRDIQEIPKDQLLEMLFSLQDDIIHIIGQLNQDKNNGFTRGSVWRTGAKTCLSYKRSEVEQIKMYLKSFPSREAMKSTLFS